MGMARFLDWLAERVHHGTCYFIVRDYGADWVLNYV